MKFELGILIALIVLLHLQLFGPYHFSQEKEFLMVFVCLRDVVGSKSRSILGLGENKH